MNHKYCAACQTIKPISEFYKNKGRSDGLSGYCVVCQRQRQVAEQTARRAELLALFGGSCERCGFSDLRALEVDHVAGGGRLERQTIPSHSRRFIIRVTANRAEYQLLCANCHRIKMHEEKEWKPNNRDKRQIPTKKKQGIGRGNSPSQKAALAQARTSEHQAAAARAKKGLSNPKVAAARRGTKLVNRHWVRP